MEMSGIFTNIDVFLRIYIFVFGQVPPFLMVIIVGKECFFCFMAD